jgi:type II secretory pathway pseudopilin PulG
VDDRSGAMTPRPTRIRCARHGGFTLLEIVLAIGLMIMLTGAIFAFYNATMSMRQDLTDSSDRLFSQRKSLDVSAQDLQSALPYAFLPGSFSGGTDQISFMRTVVPSEAVYFPPSAIDAGGITSGVAGDTANDTTGGITGATTGPTTIPASQPVWESEHDVQMVTYRLRTWVDDDNVVHIDGLERTVQRTIAAATAVEGSNIHAQLLSGQVQFVRFQYWDGAAWQDSWSSNRLPLAVRVDLGEVPAEADSNAVDYANPTLWREIYIPAGQPAAAPAAASQPAEQGTQP